HPILDLCAPDRVSILALAILRLDRVADLHLVVTRAIGRNIKTPPSMAIHQSERRGAVKTLFPQGGLYISRRAIITGFAMEFTIRRDGRELGPYSEQEIRSRLIAGTLTLSDLGLAEGTTEWKPLSTFAQFATSYREPVPPPIPTASRSETKPARTGHPFE